LARGSAISKQLPALGGATRGGGLLAPELCFYLTPAIESAVRTVGELAAEMVADARAHAVGVA